MALNGLYPVLIVKIYRNRTWQPGENPDASKTGKTITLKEWQEMPEWKKLRYHTPIPIPIYLDESFTQIACDEADQTIDFNNRTVGGLTFETIIGSDVVLSLKASKDNTVLSMIMSVIKKISEVLSQQMYSITLYYDSIFILNGMLKSITQSTINNSNIKLIRLTLSDRPAEEEKNDSSKQPIPLIPGNENGPGFQTGV